MPRKKVFKMNPKRKAKVKKTERKVKAKAKSAKRKFGKSLTRLGKKLSK
ncbi:MAG: hypothetical protein ABSA92_08960 [Candidatus Bathyarchaeia archaeon]|jgi:hypothetical protein